MTILTTGVTMPIRCLRLADLDLIISCSNHFFLYIFFRFDYKCMRLFSKIKCIFKYKCMHDNARGYGNHITSVSSLSRVESRPMFCLL